MRINVYTEELLLDPDPVKPKVCEIVTAEYKSSRTGEQMKNYGVRIYLKSPPDLHYIPGRDDDRSAVTFWCGSSEKNVMAFLDMLRDSAYASTLDTWRAKTKDVQAAAEATLTKFLDEGSANELAANNRKNFLTEWFKRLHDQPAKL